VIEDRLDEKKLDKLKFPERAAWRRQVLEDLIAKYPREFEPYLRLVYAVHHDTPDQIPELRARFVKMAKENPDDPLALLLAAVVLKGKNTPESVRLLESAKTKAPDFPLPAKALTDIYFWGKRADINKLRENLEIFFSLCPGSTDRDMQFFFAKDPELQPKVAVALRARLEKETDPKQLEDYSILWGLEFRTRAPAEHDALRTQVARDLHRLQNLHPAGDAEWQAFLVNGYKQSGAPKVDIRALEDRILREYPNSSQAFAIVQDRWAETNKEPVDETDTAAWSKFQKEYEKAVKGWMRNYPDDTYLHRYKWFYTIRQDETISEKEGIATLDAYLQSIKDFESPTFWDYFEAAHFLVEHGWQPTRAIHLGREATALYQRQLATEQDDDNASDDEVKDRNEWEVSTRQSLTGVMLKAARRAGLSNEVLALKGEIEGPPPTDQKFQSGYWLNRACFEALEGHAQDALTYYQLALQTRLEPPKWSKGKLKDDLTDEARALWKAQGGSDTAWALWSKSPSTSGERLAEGRWEKPPKAIPSFELSDLTGKTWRLKELGGETLLINLWATWCGPCQAELPHLQKFYEKIKDRPGLQLLTFNVDEELGFVAPYLKEKGYTFPVLPAYSMVVTLLDGNAIPQNWVVDPTGTWRWRQIGWSQESDAEFENEILEHLDFAKSVSPQREKP
jgi:thiol-disulfide isomerase/thioredoxin